MTVISWNTWVFGLGILACIGAADVVKKLPSMWACFTTFVSAFVSALASLFLAFVFLVLSIAFTLYTLRYLFDTIKTELEREPQDAAVVPAGDNQLSPAQKEPRQLPTDPSVLLLLFLAARLQLSQRMALAYPFPPAVINMARHSQETPGTGVPVEQDPFIPGGYVGELSTKDLMVLPLLHFIYCCTWLASICGTILSCLLVPIGWILDGAGQGATWDIALNLASVTYKHSHDSNDTAMENEEKTDGEEDRTLINDDASPIKTKPFLPSSNFFTPKIRLNASAIPFVPSNAVPAAAAAAIKATAPTPIPQIRPTGLVPVVPAAFRRRMNSLQQGPPDFWAPRPSPGAGVSLVLPPS
ncbi:hypothetical protein R3P38DRAFT_2826006 [Favolaschia claudopus]|uniref:Uncharacterized protein n=1 Tax=Favolaschia claudopus TaxID=2862362 RepID=A0AAW0EGW2_9AGAR